jgi:ABC-type nickel/cobalt efflux system permease component RcnA
MEEVRDQSRRTSDLTPPRQIVIVYLGTLLSANAKKDKTSKIIQNVVLAITFLITVLAAWWIWRKMKQARLPVWRMRRAELAAKGMDMSSLPTDPTGYAAKAQRYPLDNDKMEELDDSRDPILLNAEEPSRQSTSENGHNIR